MKGIFWAKTNEWGMIQKKLVFTYLESSTLLLLHSFCIHLSCFVAQLKTSWFTCYSSNIFGWKAVCVVDIGAVFLCWCWWWCQWWYYDIYQLRPRLLLDWGQSIFTFYQVHYLIYEVLFFSSTSLQHVRNGIAKYGLTHPYPEYCI